jgi:hypothetical protein
MYTAAMARVGRPGRARRRRGREGAAYVEFLLAFVPILTLFLGLVQLGLLYGGNLVVQHAAHRAVRTAMVVLDDDPRYFDGDARLVFDGRPATADDVEWVLARAEDAGSARRPAPLSRRAAVELSAMVLLAAIEPDDGDSIADALGTMDRGRRAEAVVGATDVELRLDRGPPGSDEPPRVRVRVVHGFACRVPVVRRLVCTDGRRRLEAEDWGAVHRGEYAFGEGDWGAE